MKRVAHIHVPRTAGDAMRSWARRGSFIYQELYKINARFKERKFVYDPDVEWTYFGHTLPSKLIADGVITEEWLDGCFKFAFVRNTWDRLVSMYEYLSSEPRRTRRPEWKHMASFGEFVRHVIFCGSSAAPRFRYKQLPWLRDGIDFVGRYERLDEDWKKLCSAVGVVHRPLNRKGIRISGGGRDFRRYYDGVLKDMVAVFYAEEIERFGFKFEENT